MQTRDAEYIDDSLRQVYRDALSEGVPDRLAKLIEQLREQEKRQKAQQGA